MSVEATTAAAQSGNVILADEEWELIFVQLSLPDLDRVRFTCTRFRDVVARVLRGFRIPKDSADLQNPTPTLKTAPFMRVRVAYWESRSRTRPGR